MSFIETNRKLIFGWEMKAKIMQVCANLPRGEKLYRFIQTRFGRLNANPITKLKTQVEMLRWLREQGMPVEGSTVFEVGTGHLPLVPIGFFLAGVEKVITVDLHKRLELTLLQKSLLWIAEKRKEIESYYADLVVPNILSQRLNQLERLKNNPDEFIAKANLQYLAPADAAHTSLPANSIDYHISVNVMEHVYPEAIAKIFLEAKRLLKSSGSAIHFIDLSDHFQHQDSLITKINFLKYTESEWLKIADNEFAYCNRLRASEFLKIFDEIGFKILRSSVQIDDESLKSLLDGFVVDRMFLKYSCDELCTTNLKVMLI